MLSAADMTPLQGKDQFRPTLVLGALGVVYGDLGTSPLYTLHAVVSGFGGSTSAETMLGFLSVLLWTLIIVLCVKYCVFVLRADNHGEGGILALMALVGANKLSGRLAWLTGLGLLGAALLYGDGIITPAISVLSALEGVNVVSPAFQAYVLPGALGVLLLLFLAQSLGTARIGSAFGPIMVIWFLVIALLGVINIAHHPEAFAAINPIHAIHLFQTNGLKAFFALGGIFLCVTGGEALYADVGHFGRWPIRYAWYGLVFPSLVLNYAGQVGLVMGNHAAIANPFFQMAPQWAVYPLVALATVATIIASQAIISGVFSLSRQAMQLGWLPGMTVRQTSDVQYGQIYVPFVNWLMMFATLALTLAFRKSDRLAGAYGMAVSTTMLLTTVLLIRCMLHNWQWRLPLVGLLGGIFLATDGLYFGANLMKLFQGGWIPLSIAICLMIVMTTWHSGVDAVRWRTRGSSCQRCLKLLHDDRVPRVPGTAVFLTRQKLDVPALLLQHIRHMGALHESVIALTVLFTDRPRVEPQHRAQAKYLGQGLWRVTVRFGFMEATNLLGVLEQIEELDKVDFKKVIWFGARDLVIHDTRHPRLGRARLELFSFLFRNSVKTMDRFSLPAENFIEVAREIKI